MIKVSFLVKSEMSANQSSPPVTTSQQIPGSVTCVTAEMKSDNNKVAIASGAVSVTETIEPMDVDNSTHSGDSKDINSEIEEPIPISHNTTPGLTPGSASRFLFESSGGVRSECSR